ncbi:MAG: putative selenium-dependent hydroxylase accessory protein YqeC [Spirochaetia bacterium]|nr:putative selenium-dependent hydroxylase accessory protein YqeC [Spirochaetia bacterium]
MFTTNTPLFYSISEYIKTHYNKNPFVVSFIGSGGKTSFIEHLTLYLSTLHIRVLIITTTHLAHPRRHTYPFKSYIVERGEKVDEIILDNPILVIGSLKDEKIGPLDENLLERIIPHYDVVLVEADGARGKNLKYHKEHEPVVPSSTSLLIKVIGLSSLGKRVDEEMHNSDLFLKEYPWNNDVVDNNLLYFLSGCKSGLNSPYYQGDSLLFYNQSDALENSTLINFIEEGREYFKNYDEKIIIGSVRKDKIVYYKDKEY